MRPLLTIFILQKSPIKLAERITMKIISHRGYWLDATEKNNFSAFERSFMSGFGTEIDIRDYKGELVISHDMPDERSILVEELFDLHSTYAKQVPLALNIKSDGLHQQLKMLLDTYDIKDYFVFDMSVPDALLYLRRNFFTFTRHSEFEPAPAYYDLAQGIWLDEFEKHWITNNVIEKHLEAGKAICIVSPELHNRDWSLEWDHYRTLEKKIGRDKLMLCTDMPSVAQEFFNA